MSIYRSRIVELATYARESIRLFKAKPRDCDVFGNAFSMYDASI
ncbi:MAG: hypothetical protein AAFS10_06755 [Myxococcota bacterium]